jgi:hypothetical protein
MGCRYGSTSEGPRRGAWKTLDKKIRPEGRKKLQQQAHQLAGTSQCGEKFIMYEINNKM